MSGTDGTTPGHGGAAIGGKLEEKVDLSQETEEKIQQGQQLTSQGQLTDALALLSALEKRCRVGNDNASLAKVCKASVELCKQANNSEELITTLNGLATRRSQKTVAIRTLVQTALPYCVQEPYTPVACTTPAETEARDKLVVTLRDISDGKIFLEKERAILTRVLASIKEQEGDISQAADVLQQVHVETYGSLSKRDKVEFILEQMRLTMAKRDFIRAAVVASKVSKKHLKEEHMESYKIKFYELMTIYHRYEKDPFELAKDYYAIYNTPNTVLNDETKWIPALQSTVVFLALSPYNNEQQDMMHRIFKDPNLEKLPSCQSTIKLFLKKEIINYPMPHQAELESFGAFTIESSLIEHWHDMFHRRMIQHNIRVIAMYYKRIHGTRLAQLLQLDGERLEREIAGMVSDGTVYAKIDRPADIVRFSATETPESILSDWAGDIDQLLHLVETTTHLIHKENMTSQ